MTDFQKYQAVREIIKQYGYLADKLMVDVKCNNCQSELMETILSPIGSLEKVERHYGRQLTGNKDRV